MSTSDGCVVLVCLSLYVTCVCDDLVLDVHREHTISRLDLLLRGVVDGANTGAKVVSLSSFSLIEFCIEMTNLGLSYV